MVAQLRKNMQRRCQLKVYVLEQGTQHVEGVKAGNDKDFFVRSFREPSARKSHRAV